MDKKYIAFISYRHRLLDSAVAAALHRKIERYTIPAALRNGGTRRLGRAFRDREELAVGTDLSSKIRAALDDSRYLIVVCSPETPASYWCCQEIDYFLSRYGRENILLVLADGTPETSIPPQLRQSHAEDGTVQKTAEPLCADLVSRSSRLSVKLLTALTRLGDEFLRLAATMLGCSFDNLKQRKKRRTRRILLAAAAAALTVIGALTSQNITIRRQNLEISEQNLRIEEQLRQTQLKESEALSLLSNNQLRLGDRRDAVLSAYNALYAETGTRPYYAPALEALSEALLLYREPEFTEDYRLQLRNPVGSIFFSRNGQYAVILEQRNTVALADVPSGRILWETECTLGGKPKAWVFPERRQVAISTQNSFFLYSTETGECLREISAKADAHVLTPSGNIMAAWTAKTGDEGSSSITFYDLDSGEPFLGLAFQDPMYHMQFLREDSFLLCTGTDTGTRVAVVNYTHETLEELGSCGTFVTAAPLREDATVLLFRESSGAYHYAVISADGVMTELTQVQYVPQQYGWTTPMIQDEILSILGDGTWIYLISRDNLYTVYREDGTLVEQIPLQDSVCTVFTDHNYERRAAAVCLDSLGRLNIACENSTIYSYYPTGKFHPDRLIYGNPVAYVDASGKTIPVNWNRSVLYSNPEVARVGYGSFVYNEITVGFSPWQGDTVMITDSSAPDNTGLKVLRLMGDTQFSKQPPAVAQDLSESILQQRRSSDPSVPARLTAFRNGTLYWSVGKEGIAHYWEDPEPIENYTQVKCPYEVQRYHPKVLEEPASGGSGLAIIAGCLDGTREGGAVYSIADGQWKFCEQLAGVPAQNICAGQTEKLAAWIQNGRLFLYEFSSGQILREMQTKLSDISAIQFALEDSCLVIAERTGRALLVDVQTFRILGEYSMETDFLVKYEPEDLLLQTDTGGTVIFLSDGYSTGLILDRKSWEVIGRVSAMICYDPAAEQICCWDGLHENILFFPFRSAEEIMDIAKQQIFP